MAVFEVTTKAKLNGQDCVNVLHFEKPNATQDDMTVLAQRVEDQWIGHVCNVVSSHVNFYQLQVRHLAINPWVTIVAQINRNGTFFSSASFSPMCLVLQKRTQFAGVRNRGRLYISGMYSSDLVAGGFWSPQQVVRNLGLCTNLKSNWVTPNTPWGFKLIITPGDVLGPIGVDVTDLVPRSFPGTQSRRSLFRGN